MTFSVATVGGTNLFFYPIPEDGWDKAIDIAIKKLEHFGLAEKAIVARCDFVLAESGEYEAVEKIVWPPGYQGSRPW